MNEHDMEKWEDARVRSLIKQGLTSDQIASQEPHLKKAVQRVCDPATLDASNTAPADIRLEIAQFAAAHHEETREKDDRTIVLTGNDTLQGAVAKLLQLKPPKR